MRADPLRGDLLWHLHVEPERIAEEGERFAHVLDRDPDVIEDSVGGGSGGSAFAGISVLGGTRPTYDGISMLGGTRPTYDGISMLGGTRPTYTVDDFVGG